MTQRRPLLTRYAGGFSLMSRCCFASSSGVTSVLVGSPDWQKRPYRQPSLMSAVEGRTD
jgi:hypothetical protein